VVAAWEFDVPQGTFARPSIAGVTLVAMSVSASTTCSAAPAAPGFHGSPG
jgi:hypothetical protein